ncbi:MAG: peptide deformylase [Rickettsiales bacterium]|nr:peptide deformylase [Rickettsiales bacterium]|tara:strand:+ start:2123 stop:2647 length:525 start_codon:yes stop_codon:yes gene_type:complete
MAILKVLEPPAPVLRQVAKPVEAVTDEIRAFLDDMLETMYDDKGIGLAAPQVGVSKRLVTIDLQQRGEDEQPQIYYFVNPEIIWESDEIVGCMEGCLSIPGQFAEVERPAQVKVKYLDYYGEEQILEADGLMSACIQHEIDHLNGVLFVDHLSALKRNMLMKKLKKSQKQRGIA